MAFKSVLGAILFYHVLMPISVGGTACHNAVDGATANAGTPGCACPKHQGVRGTDEACLAVFGKRYFEPDGLADKNCQCVSKVTLYLSFFNDHLGGIGENSEENIAQLESWLDEVNRKAAEEVAKLEERWVDIKEGVAQHIERLEDQFREAAEQKKQEIKAHIAKLKNKLAEVRRAIEEMLREKIHKVANDARTLYSDLQKQITQAAQDKKAALLELAKAVRERLLEMHAGAISNTPSRQSLEVSTELLYESVGSLRVQYDAPENSLNLVKKFELDQKIKELKKQLKLLKSAAINKGKEMGAAFARFLEVTSERIGELREQLQTAAGEKKREIEAEISKHLAELAKFRKAAAEQRAQFRTRITKAIEGLGEDIGKLQEQLKNAWWWNKPVIQQEIAKFKERLSRLRSEAQFNQAEVEARLVSIMSGVSTRIGELKEQLKQVVGEKAAAIEENLKELKSMLEKLKASAIKKHAAVRLQVASLKAKLAEHIAKLQERVQTATQDKKAVLQKALEEAQALLGRIASAVDGVVDDVRGTLEALLAKLRSLHDQAQDAAKADLSDKISRFEELVNKLIGSSAPGDDVAAVCGESAVVLAEYFGQANTTMTHAVQQLTPYQQQLQSALADMGGQMEALLTDAVESISVIAGELQASLEATGSWDIVLGLTPSSNAEVEAQFESARALLTKLRSIAVDLKAALEEELSEAAEALGEKLGQFQEKIVVAVSDKKEAIQQTITNLQSHLSVLMTTAGRMRAELEGQLMDVVGAVSEQIGDFKERLAQAAEDRKAKIREHGAKLQVRLTSLRDVVAQKFEESKGALETATDSLSERVGELQEKVKTATGALQTEMQARMEQLKERLEYIKTTGQGLMARVREQRGLVSSKVSEFLGELREKLESASRANKKDIQDKLDLIQARLSLVRASMTEHWQAKYAAVVHHMEERISKMKEQLEGATDQAKIELQNKIDEYTKHLEQMKKAVETRYAAIHELLGSLDERMAAYISELKVKLQSATGEAQSKLETRIAELEALWIQVQDATRLKTEEAIRNAQQKFTEKVEALRAAMQNNPALSSYVDTLSDWLSRLQSCVDDEGIDDIVGAAVTADVIDQIVDELQTDGTSRRLSEDDGLVQSLQESKASLWEVVDMRSKEADNVPDFEPMPVPTPPPSENPFVVSSANTIRSLSLAVASVIATMLVIGI